MNQKKIPVYALLLVLCSCSSTTQPSPSKKKLSIILQIIPEGENTYSISWKDSLGRKEFNGIPNRPVELWCHVRNADKDTIGYYRGSSIPKDYVVFETAEASVEVQFSKNINRSSKLFSDSKLLQSYLKEERNFIEFQTSKIEIADYLRKEGFIQLEQATPRISK